MTSPRSSAGLDYVNAGPTSTLYRGGTVYAPGTPRATALLIDGAEIVWVGTDEAADRLGRPDRTVDLAGALVTPAFVDAHVRWPDAGHARTPADDRAPEATLAALKRRAAAYGIAGLHAMASNSDSGEELTALLAADAGALGADVVPYRPEPAARAGDALRAATADGRQAAVLVADPDALDVLLAAAHRLVESVGLPRVVGARHRVELTPAGLGTEPDGEQLGELARLGLVVSVQPVLAEQVRIARAQHPPPLHALAAAGVPFAFGSGAPHGAMAPWGAVRVASSTAWGSSALSARAAFAAASRGGRRLARQDREGVLRPGSPATFAVWTYAGELVVRTPDARVAAWSTDPRAATPGLPDLTGDGPDPQCRRTVVRGLVAHDDGFLSVARR